MGQASLDAGERCRSASKQSIRELDFLARHFTQRDNITKCPQE